MEAELIISVAEENYGSLKALKIFEISIKKYGCFKYKKFNEPYHSEVTRINRACRTFVNCSQKMVRYKIISLNVNNSREAVGDFLKAINFFIYISKEVYGDFPDFEDYFSISLKITDTSQKWLRNIKWHIKNKSLFPYYLQTKNGEFEEYSLYVTSDNCQDKKLVKRLIGTTDLVGCKTFSGSKALELKERTGVDITDLPFLSFVGKTNITVRKTNYQYYD